MDKLLKVFVQGTLIGLLLVVLAGSINYVFYLNEKYSMIIQDLKYEVDIQWFERETSRIAFEDFNRMIQANMGDLIVPGEDGGTGGE